MPVYVWVAQTKKGRNLKGEIDAATEAIALSMLKKRNFLPLNEIEKYFEHLRFRAHRP